jgi:hypothetical protein
VEITNAREFLHIREAAAIYGGSIAWWRKAVWLRQIPVCKRGARVVFRRADLERYFEARRVPVKGEVA